MTDKAATDKAEDETEAKKEILNFADLGSLTSLARSSEDHEAYCVVAAREHFRVGLVVDAAPDTTVSFRIEVLLQILAKDTQPSMVELERMNKILENLTKRGYSMDHHDSGWVTCERALAADDIDNECMAVMAIVQRKRGVET